ncbi:MAG: helix-turn-helix domain-containing protein, partial [Ktedonobacteraceae bacterium]|nr:helix-turn-helix domain-containing protein [Ktedonobacteraceae bacterium]
VDLQLWERLCDSAARGQPPHFTTAELDQLNPLRNVQWNTLLPLPLLTGTEQIGLLNCYFSSPWQGSSDELLMLATIANQAALAIKYRLSLEEQALAQKTSVKAFMEDLLSTGGDESLQRRAYLLGYDLARPHVVAVVELSDLEVDWHAREVTPEERRERVEALSNRLQQNVQECYPGSLVEEHDNLLVCLFSLEDDSSVREIASWLDHLLRHLGREWQVGIAAGIGNACDTVADYRRGYAEAGEALKLSQFLKRSGNCVHFNDLGAYRYLYRFAHEDTLSDQYQEQVAAIVAYDQRKKTNLLDTLEMYLDCGGNVTRTSTQLQVHRNTLLQRMERLHKLCNLDLEQVQHRFPLLAAIKIHRLRTPGTPL